MWIEYWTCSRMLYDKKKKKIYIYIYIYIYIHTHTQCNFLCSKIRLSFDKV